MRILIILVTFIWLCWGGINLFSEPKSMASYAIVATGLIAFLTAIANYQKVKKENNGQSQIVKSNSSGIQVGGNYYVNKKDNE